MRTRRPRSYIPLPERLAAALACLLPPEQSEELRRRKAPAQEVLALFEFEQGNGWWDTILKRAPNQPLDFGEVWLPIRGYEGIYEVSNYGRVRSLPRTYIRICHVKKRILSTKSGPDGYPRANLCVDGKPATRLVHQLVAEAFIGPCPPGKLVCHNDGTRKNSKLSNLRYDTNSGNMADRLIHETSNRFRTPKKYPNQDKISVRAARAVRYPLRGRKTNDR